LLHSGDLDFSFAGLKTAVLTQAKKLDAELETRKADLAASTQAAIVEVLVKKSMAALDQCGLDRLVVAGGVGANKALRAALKAACAKHTLRVHYPEPDLCTDNGAMIAMAAAMRLAAACKRPACFTLSTSSRVGRWRTCRALLDFDLADLAGRQVLGRVSVSTPFSSLAALVSAAMSCGNS